VVVEPVPVVGLGHVDLFSGIGGFSLAARWVGGFDTIAFCEIDEYARRVLKRNFPGIPIFEDVAELHPADLIPRDGRVDVVTAGFPCQDLSVAGARRGLEADRSGLFFEIVRLADEIYAYCGVRPILVLENVPGLLSGDGGAWARRVYGELAGRGYHCEWKVVSAADVGAPHLRRRWWCVCYVADTGGPGSGEGSLAERIAGKGWGGAFSESEDLQSKNGKARSGHFGPGSEAMADTGSFGHQGRNRTERGAGERIFQQEEQGRHPLGGEIAGRSEPCGAGTAQLGLGGMADGIPSWLDEPGDIPRVASGEKDRVARLKGLGNAVVPQVAMIPLLRAKEILTGEHYEAGEC
jgi:DNA (cytosine-5)-methyltransferase 1